MQRTFIQRMWVSAPHIVLFLLLMYPLKRNHAWSATNKISSTPTPPCEKQSCRRLRNCLTTGSQRNWRQAVSLCWTTQQCWERPTQREGSFSCFSIYMCLIFGTRLIRYTLTTTEFFFYRRTKHASIIAKNSRICRGIQWQLWAQDSDKRNAGCTAYAILISSLHLLNPSNNKSRVLWWVVHIRPPGRSGL
jgi:hypothetical protein